MMYVRLAISVLPLSVFAVMLYANWRIFYHVHFKRDSTATAVPLIGGIAGVLGFWLLPLGEGKIYWMFMPLIVEWGSLPLLIFASISHLLRHKESDSHKPTPP